MTSRSARSWRTITGAVRYEIIEFVTTRSAIPGIRPLAETEARPAS
ncbi:hypothetical protein [Spirillospora sp. CA-128828]